MLNLAEMYLILMLDERKPFDFRLRKKSSARQLARALLEELILRGDIQIIDNLCYPTPSRIARGDPALDCAYQEILQSIELKTLYGWVSALSVEGDLLEKRIASRLVEQGIISVEPTRQPRLLGDRLATRRELEILHEIVLRLREICLRCGQTDERSLALLRLLKQAGQLQRVFHPEEERVAWQVIEQYEAIRTISLLG